MKINNGVMHAQFISPCGITEHFFAVSSRPGSGFAEEAAQLLAAYEDGCQSRQCSAETEMLLRFHLSDITNQAPQLRKLLGDHEKNAVLIGQPPADGSRIALEAWHFSRPVQNYRVLFTRLAQMQSASSYEQTAAEFAHLAAQIAPAPVLGTTVRTWLYCRDVDNNYAGLVKARNDFFASAGITEKTGFLASTGIEGQPEDPHRLVRMDALSVFGLKPGQLLHLNAPDFLSPTWLYHVAFERASLLRTGDREHIFISGTASIDSRGNVVHPGSVREQSRRLLTNINELLKAGGMTLAELKQATVYLRDPADAEIVRQELLPRLPEALPILFVRAPVCRPAWLVEMEAIALCQASHPEFSPFA